MVLVTHPPTCISPLVGGSNRDTTGQDAVWQQEKERSVDCGPHVLRSCSTHRDSIGDAMLIAHCYPYVQMS